MCASNIDRLAFAAVVLKAKLPAMVPIYPSLAMGAHELLDASLAAAMQSCCEPRYTQPILWRVAGQPCSGAQEDVVPQLLTSEPVPSLRRC